MARRPVELCRAAAPARQGPRVVRDRGAHGVMVDVEGGGDGADLPVFAEIESANLGVPVRACSWRTCGDTRRIGQHGGRSHALSRPQTIQRRAPARGALGE